MSSPITDPQVFCLRMTGPSPAVVALQYPHYTNPGSIRMLLDCPDLHTLNKAACAAGFRWPYDEEIAVQAEGAPESPGVQETWVRKGRRLTAHFRDRGTRSVASFTHATVHGGREHDFHSLNALLTALAPAGAP